MPKVLSNDRASLGLKMTRIVCQQDIIQIIQKFPDITSDELASGLAIGIRLQDVLLETVKLLVTKLDSLPNSKD